jgi:hypothetical protein
MAHPELTHRDPVYWVAIVVLMAAIPIMVWIFRRGRPVPDFLGALAAIVIIILALLSAFYVMLASACYIGGDCL